MTWRGSCFSSPRSVPVNASPPQPPTRLPLPQPAPARLALRAEERLFHAGDAERAETLLLFPPPGRRRLRVGSRTFLGGSSGPGLIVGPCHLVPGAVSSDSGRQSTPKCTLNAIGSLVGAVRCSSSVTSSAWSRASRSSSRRDGCRRP